MMIKFIKKMFKRSSDTLENIGLKKYSTSEIKIVRPATSNKEAIDQIDAISKFYNKMMGKGIK